MRQSNLFAALSLSLAALASHAGEAYPIDFPGPGSALTRTEVRALTLQAARAGQVPQGEANAPSSQPGHTVAPTRAQVRAETIEARRLGLVMVGEQLPRAATPADLQRIRDAGLRAVGLRVAGDAR